MLVKIIVVLLILLIPQIYFWIQDIRYKSLDMTSKFFKRATVKKDDFYEEIYLTNTDGFDSFVRILTCENPKAIVQLIHGVAEHSGNYLDFARFLNKNGYIVVIGDHRGHGKSISTAYPNGYMKRAEELIDDEVMIAKYMKKEYPDLKYFVLGHSMGSMIARLFLRENDDLLDKLIITGTVPVNKAARLGVSYYNLGCFYLGDKAESRLIDAIVGAKGLDFISYSPQNIDIKANDPLRIFKFKIGYSKTLIEVNKLLGQKSKYKCKNPKLDIYNMVGEDDIITKGEKGIKDSLNFLRELGYEDIKSKTYKGMKHEILNETNKDLVYQDILSYFDGE
ncbi:alpha/beta fold hydrolase [uncultured Anaerococcus sp.]|uniref:alpha/beta fold hydrolase n=1 Tax=uncultured Anaerococcus sp. TaxID=293428 RepID=UPI0028897F68|nr:alpha/beta fold hydrolase [uncultured Anaerococcus sp.]